MKGIVIYGLSVAVAGLICWSCGPKDEAVRVEEVKGQKFYSCDIPKVKDSLNVPLSRLVKSVHVVKLENSPEALLGDWVRPVISENYIGVMLGQQPFKLFDKNGKFICNIGAIGKGPGEYRTLGCARIDEKAGLVYLLPWQSTSLLCYRLDGSFVAGIPLKGRIPKGNFRMGEHVITVFALPLPGIDKIVWQTDGAGNVEGVVEAEPYTEPDGWYSNEMESSFNGELPDLYVFRWNPRQDTLYHYDGKSLIPGFSATYEEAKVPMHQFVELPGHYFVILSEVVNLPDGNMTVGNHRFLVVDKKEERAGWGRVKDDLFLVGEDVWTSADNFKDKKYVQSYSAIYLLERLEKMLEREDVPASLRKQAEDLLKNLNEEDNNIIVWGELK